MYDDRKGSFMKPLNVINTFACTMLVREVRIRYNRIKRISYYLYDKKVGSG